MADMFSACLLGMMDQSTATKCAGGGWSENPIG